MNLMDGPWASCKTRVTDHGSQTSNRHISNLCVVALFIAGHWNLPPIGAASAWCGIPRRRNFAPRSATRCRTIPAINQQQGEDTTPPIPSPDAFLLVFHRGRAALFVSLLFFPLVHLLSRSHSSRDLTINKFISPLTPSSSSKGSTKVLISYHSPLKGPSFGPEIDSH